MVATALFIWPVFFLISFFLFRKSKLSILSNTYSNLGAHSKYGYLFNLLLVTVGTFQLIFLGTIFKMVLPLYNIMEILGLSCLIITTVAGIFTGLITERSQERLHISIAKVGFGFSIIGYILYGLFFLPSNFVTGIFMLGWGFIVMPYQGYRHLSGKKVYAKNEFFMFLGAFLTNVALVSIYY